MEITQITVLEDVELNNPVFIEALPGIGHVGKLECSVQLWSSGHPWTPRGSALQTPCSGTYRW